MCWAVCKDLNRALFSLDWNRQQWITFAFTECDAEWLIQFFQCRFVASHHCTHWCVTWKYILQQVYSDMIMPGLNLIYQISVCVILDFPVICSLEAWHTFTFCSSFSVSLLSFPFMCIFNAEIKLTRKQKCLYLFVLFQYIISVIHYEYVFWIS